MKHLDPCEVTVSVETERYEATQIIITQVEKSAERNSEEIGKGDWLIIMITDVVDCLLSIAVIQQEEKISIDDSQK